MGIDLNRINEQLAHIGYQELDQNNQPVASGNDYVNGVPKSLVDAVIRQESGGNPNARSKVGATGMMQLMPDTARDLGLIVNDKVDERLDPEKNIHAGTQYLKSLYDKYQNWDHALAAYNWGPGNVDKWIANGADKSLLPEETRNYLTALGGSAPKNWAGRAIEGVTNLLGGVPIQSLEQKAVPGTAETSDVDYAEQGALNSLSTDMWNSFKKGIDETQKSFSFGKLDDHQEVIDNAPDEIANLESQKNAGLLDEETFKSKVSEINGNVAEAQQKVDDYQQNIAGQEQEIANEPVSKRYQLQSQLTQAAGSNAGFWDSFKYSLPETAGSSASLMGQQLAATFGSGIAKNLIAAGVGLVAPEPVATKIAAGTALASAIGLLANSRDQESAAEIGDAIQTAQTELINQWAANHPGQQPTDEDLRKIRQQARVGKNDLYWQNMALAIPDVAEAVLLPGSSLGPLFQEAASLERGFEALKNANKFTRMAGYGAGAYADWTKEKFEEGFQYAAQQRQYNEALDLGLYDNKGLIKNILTDSFDALQSLDYSPVGIVRDADGRYSHDPNFQFAEGSGGMLGLFSGGISIPISAAKDLYLYNKVNKELRNDPFNDGEDKTFKLKSEILFNHFENDTVHHLVEGLKSLSTQKDVNGNPLLSKDDLDKEVGNIAIAKQKYDSVNNYINSFGNIFSSKELKENKKLLKQDLFETTLRLTKYESELNKLSGQKAKMRGASSPVGQIMDLNSQIQIREQYIKQLQNETENKVDPDEAVLYDYDKKLSILKKQVAKLKREQQDKIKNLTEEDYKKYTAINLGKDLSKMEDYDPIADETSIEQDNLNAELVPPSIHRDFYADRYAEYRRMKSIKQATDYINKRVDESQKKKDILDKNQPEPTKTEEKTTPTGEEGTETKETKPPVTTTGATAQKVGTLEEHPIVSEAVDNEGFMNYTIMKPDGTTEQVSQKEAWYKTNEAGQEEARKDPRHMLQGVDHFLSPFKYNLTKEERTLERVAKRLGKSKAEILKEFPDAFPAHVNQALLNKILSKDNYRDYIDIVVTRKFAEKNVNQDPVVFSSATGLRGLRVQGLSMILRLTDPEDSSNTTELFEIYPPDFYALADKDGNLKPVDFTDGNQMDLAKFNTMFTKFGGEDFTESEFNQFVRNWKAVKEFKTALETGLKAVEIAEPIVLPKSSYNIQLSGEFAYIRDPKKPFIKMKDSSLLKEAPIYYFDIDPTLSHWVTELTMQPAQPLTAKKSGYYAPVNTKAGFRWVKLTPGKIIAPGERDEVIGAEVKRVVDALYDLDVNDLSSLDQAKQLVKSLKFFVASYGNTVITPFAKLQGEHYVLDYTIEQGDKKVHVYMDKLLKNGTPVDYNYKFIVKKLNEAIIKADFTGQPINETNFRTNPSKDLLEKDYEGDVRDLFDITVEAGIVGNFSPKFHLGATSENVSDKTPKVDPTPVNSQPAPTPKPASTPTPVATDAKADIERRRNLALKNIHGVTEIKRGVTRTFWNTYGAKDGIIFKQTNTEEELISEINAKYDVELAALKGTTKQDSLENNNPTLNNPSNLSDEEQQEKDREDGTVNDAFKIADKGDIDYPLSLVEQEEYLAKMLPAGFTRADLSTLHNKVAKNGMVVGAVINRAIYLRDVADRGDLLHEAFHVVFRNLLSDERAQTYLNKVASTLNYSEEKLAAEKKKLRDSGLYDQLTDEQLEDQVYEEYLADNFLEWKKGQEKKSWLRQLFDKIMNLIRFFTNDDVRGLYAAIDRGYFKNSAILKTKYNSEGSANTAYKLLVGATQAQSSDIINQVLAKVLVDNFTIGQAINYFVEFYNPQSEENQEIISSNPALEEEFKKFQNIFLSSANQRLIHEIAVNKLKSYGIDKKTLDQMVMEVDESDEAVEESAEKQWDLTDAYIDPYNRVNRKLKRIMDTTTYTAYFNGKKYKKTLDSRIFYSRMLPVLSISNLPGDKIMSRLKSLSKWDAQVKAFYERLVEITGYNPDTQEVDGVVGKQIYNSLVKAFELEQMVYFEPVSNISEGKAVSNKVHAVNKIDLGEYRLTEWSNYWKTNILGGILEDAKQKKSITDSIDSFLTKVKSGENIDGRTIGGLKSALDKLGISVELPYLYYSFGTTAEAEDLKENFSTRAMTTEDLVQIKTAISRNDDLYGKTTAANKSGAQGRMQDIANGNAVFDTNLILKTYLDSENKTRYAYVASNMVLSENRRLKTLTTKQAIEEEKQKNNGYFALNPLFTDNAQAANIFSNLNIGLANSFRTAVDKVDQATKKTKEVKDVGVTGKAMDPDTMIGVMHILFTSSFQTKATKVKYARYWLSQISDKNTQYAVEMPTTRFWSNGEFNADAKEKLFNLVKQEYLRNQGKFGEYIKKDKFLYFPFLSPSLLKGSLAELEAQKEDILSQIQSEFKTLAVSHKKDLQSKGLMNGDVFTFLDNKALTDEFGTVDNYIGNFITNHFIYTTGLLQFYAGDIAWSKGWDDFVKRMAGTIASGNNFADRMFTVVHATDAVDYIDRATLNPSEKGAKNAVENNTADAQVWSTAATKKMLLESLGELSPTLSSAFDKIIAGEDKKLTKAEKKEVDIISDKLVGYGVDTDGNRQYNKQSTFFLTIGLTSMQDREGNWVAQPHRESLHNIRVYLENLSKNQEPILLSPKSANKLYKSPTPVEIKSFEKTGDVKTESAAVTKVDGKYYRKQQENDSKEKDSIIFVRQLIDVLGSEIKDPKTRETIEQFRKDLAAIRNESFNFASKLIVNEVGDKYERANLEIWLESLRHNIEISTPDSQMLEYLSLPEVDLNLPHLQSKTKTLFLNTFKSSFQKRIAGRKCTLISPFGFKVIVDKSTGKVVTTEEIVKSKNPEKFKDSSKYEMRDLRIHKIDKDSEGNVTKQEAEFLMTRKTAEMMGINISDPTKADYLKVFGVRIPLQSYHSTSVGRIVDFLPDYYGDVVVGPKELVHLGGMDFDVDALYMFLPNMFKNAQGETVLYGQESSDEERFYGFKSYLLKNNNTISREVYKTLLNNDDFRALKVELPLGEDLGEASDSSIIASIIDGEVKDSMIQKLTEQAVTEVLQKFGYPATLEAFVASKMESEGVIQNRIHNSIHSILMSDELADAYKQPANHDKIDQSLAYLENIGALDPNRKANIIPNTPVSVSDAYANSIKGKDLTGIAVNANTVGATLTEYEVELRDAAAIIFGTEKDSEGNTVPKRYSSFASDPATHRIKADAGSTTVTGTVDNANKPVSRDLNFSRHTLPQRNILIQLGETDYEFIDSYFALPIMKEVVEGLETASRALSPAYYTVLTGKNRLANKIKLVIGEMTARGDGAGANVSLLEHRDKELKRLQSQAFSKQELESVHKLAKSSNMLKDPANMSDEELKNLLSYYMIQLTALSTYQQLSYIADYAQDISKIMSLNRRLNPDMEALTDYLASVEKLQSTDTPFKTEGVDRILSNPNVASNIDNVGKIIKMSELFFLDNTKFMAKFKATVEPALNLNFQDRADVQRNFISFVTMQLLQHSSGKSYDSYYELVVPGFTKGSKTLAEQFNDLVKTDSEGKPLNPEFYNNPFTKIVEPMMAKDNSSSAIDILATDSRAKFSSQTLDKYIDSIQAMFRSSDPAIRAFATNMIKYVMIKDSMQFKNYSFIKLLPASSFAKIAEVLSKLNKEVAYKSYKDVGNVEELTGKTAEQLYKQFLEIYARLNPGKVTNVRLGDLDNMGNEINDNLAAVSDSDQIKNGLYRAFDYKVTDNGLTLSQNITDFRVLSNLPRSIKKFIENEGNEIFSLNFPSVIAMNGNKSYIYVETSRKKEAGKVTVTYKRASVLNTKGILPYTASISTTEQVSNMILKTLKEKSKNKSNENVNEAALRAEEESATKTETTKEPVLKLESLTLKDGKEYTPAQINGTMLIKMGYTPTEAGEIIKNLCI